jgi:hypothetical protein
VASHEQVQRWRRANPVHAWGPDSAEAIEERQRAQG